MKDILDNIIKEIEFSPYEKDIMRDELNKFLDKSKKRIKHLGIDATIFIGGSYGKGTGIKKKMCDIDIYLIFRKTYDQKDYPKLTKKIFNFIKNKKIIHGSRDYLKIPVFPWLFFEIVPVQKTRKNKGGVNITDLSFAHVQYLKQKIKKKNIIDGIKLAKAFCIANKTYGAESYVNGFSGYALELLVYYYGGFEKFLKGIIKKRKKKLVIDIENDYKNLDPLLEINGSKLGSPVILIDPTFKSRNVLAALSESTFKKFVETAEAFLKKPSKKFFHQKKTDIIKISEYAKGKKLEFIEFKIKTSKQEGDIAGTKLLKFHKHLIHEIKKYFNVVEEGFDYGGKNIGRGYFVLKKKNYILYSGPNIGDKENIEKFKCKHSSTYIKRGRIFSKKKIDISAKEYLNHWVKQYKTKMKEMYIQGIIIRS